MSKWKLSAFMMLLPLAASAQGGGESVSKHFRAFVTHHTKILIDAAESMPADKYGYKPTAAQWTFGKIIAHMAGDNRITCSAIAGTASEKSPEPSVSGLSVTCGYLPNGRSKLTRTPETSGFLSGRSLS